MADPIIIEKAKQVALDKGIDPYLFLGVIKHESAFKPDNINTQSGAMGLGQIMPENVNRMNVKDAFDVDQNLDAAGNILSGYLRKYAGNARKALAAYGGFKTKDPSAYIKSIEKNAEEFRTQDANIDDLISQAEEELGGGEAPQLSDADVSKLMLQAEAEMKGKASQGTEAPQGFIAGSVHDIGKRFSNMGQELTPQGDESLWQSIKNSPERALRIVGQAAGGVGDVVGQGIKGLYKTFVPDSAQEAIASTAKDILKTPVGVAGLQALKGGIDTYRAWKAENPNAAKDLEAVVNIGTLLPVGKAAQLAGSGAKMGVEAAKEGISVLRKAPLMVKSEGKLNTMLDAVIDDGINKAIRPSVSGKKNFSRMEKYDNSANTAVKDMIENKGSISFERNGEMIQGQTPKTLGEFSQAVEKRMDDIVENYTSIAKESQGAVNSEKIAKGLDSIISDPDLVVARPDLINSAVSLQERLMQRGPMSVVEAQKQTQMLNTVAKEFYKSGELSHAFVYEKAAMELRKEIGNVLGSAGPEYKNLRKLYGNYATIEQDIARRWQVDKRANPYGFFDLANIATFKELATAIATKNPSALAKAGAMVASKAYIKHMNKPSTQLTKMFSQSEKIMDVLKNKRPGSAVSAPSEPFYVGNLPATNADISTLPRIPYYPDMPQGSPILMPGSFASEAQAGVDPARQAAMEYLTGIKQIPYEPAATRPNVPMNMWPEGDFGTAPWKRSMGLRQ